MSETRDFVNRWNNKLINFGGTQCVAVANQFNKEVVGAGWISANWANDWYRYFYNDPIQPQFYDRIPGDQRAQEGDVAIWDIYPGTNLPHIAIVLEDRGGELECFTQNPGNAHVETLKKGNRFLGYCRPKKFVVKGASDEEIKQAYRDILEREADSGGLSHYRNSTIDFVRNDLSNSQEKRDLEARKAAEAVQPTPQPVAGLSVGDAVFPNELVDYTGQGLQAWDSVYTITELIGDRAVLSARGAIWAAVNVNNLHKV